MSTSINEPTRPVLRMARSALARLQMLLSPVPGVLMSFLTSVSAPNVRLTAGQNVALHTRQLTDLANRTTLWMCTLTFASFIILGFVSGHPTPMFGFTKWLWTLGLVALLGLQLYFAQSLRRILESVTAGKLSTIHMLWCAWVTLIALWWMAGAWTLPLPQRPRLPGTFEFTNFTFMFLTLPAQAITILFLAPSVRSIASAVLLGFSVPYIAFRLQHMSSGGSGNLYWTMSQIGVYFVIGIFVASEYKRGKIREFLLEAERARANHFVAAISHDLRQPLTAIMFRLQGLESKVTSPEILGNLRTISQQAISIENMVNGTLDLSRLESGTWSVSKRDVSLPTILDSIASDLQPEAQLHNVELIVHSKPYLIRTDPVAFERIVRNLVGNALRYAPGSRDRRGHVQLRCDVQDERIRISVIDDGIGIPASRIEDIFKEYVQLANPERDQRKGLGLGLSIVRGLASLLGHELDLESTEGVGSRFSVFVPISAQIPPELLGFAEPAQQAADPSLGGMLVALVEDNEDARTAMREHLQRWDCRVVDGESAQEVLVGLSEESGMKRPDFILSDYRLRNGNTGVEAIAHLRTAFADTIPAAIWTAETTPSALQDIACAKLPRLSKPPELLFLASLLTNSRPEGGSRSWADASMNSSAVHQI